MFANTLRIHDFNVRYGESPGDSLVQVAYVASLDAATNVIKTALAPGTRVVVVPYTTAVVDASGNLTLAANPEPAAGQAGGYLLFAPAYALQGGVLD
jgi:uncharacterized protein GlcG (DUF336 family)